MVSPGEVMVEGKRIRKAGSSVSHPAGAQMIDLGDRTLMPGLIDAHVHLFLHPGAEDSRTIEQSVPQRSSLRDSGAITRRRPEINYLSYQIGAQPKGTPWRPATSLDS